VICHRVAWRCSFALVLFIGLLVCGTSAQAGTFCIVGPGLPAQCEYDDVRNCLQSAQPPTTFCQINPDAVLMYHGPLKYCIVQSDRLAQCLYIDRKECNAIAAQQGAVCFDRMLLNDDINPFRFDDRIQN
jgi:hypothetical protein